MRKFEMARRFLVTTAGMMAIAFVAFGLGYTFSNNDAAYVQPTVFSWPEAKTLTPGDITVEEFKAKLERGDRVVLLDARTPEEYQAGHIKGALSLPLSQLDARYPAIQDRLSSEAELITYCSGSSCQLNLRLAEALIAKGHSRVKTFSGGWTAWQAAGLPVESGGGS